MTPAATVLPVWNCRHDSPSTCVLQQDDKDDENFTAAFTSSTDSDNNNSSRWSVDDGHDGNFTTDDDEEFPYPSQYSWLHIGLSAAVVTVIMLIIVLGNALVVLAISRDRRHLGGLQNWFIVSLAVSDLLVGLFIMPLSLANELMGYWAFGDLMCEVWLATDVLLCTASILNLVVISLDRYWSIAHAITYLQQRTRARVAGMIAAVWLLSIAVSLPPLAGWKRPQPFKMGFPLCVLSEEPGYVIYSTVGSFYVPLIVIVVVYTKIYLAARSRARRRIQTAAAAKMYLGSNKSTAASQTATALSPQAATSAAEESVGRVQRRKLPPNTLSIDYNPNQQQQQQQQSHRHVRHSISVSTTISNLSRPTPVTPQTTFSDCLIDATAVPLSTTEVNDAERGVVKETDFNDYDSSLDDETTDDVDDRLYNEATAAADRFAAASAPTFTNEVPGSTTTMQIATVEIDGKQRRNSQPEIRRNLSKTTAPTVDKPETANNSSIDDHERNKKRLARARERRATVVFGIVMASFVGCWLPFFTLYPITLLLGISIPDQVFAVIFWLGYCNSALNPIIYTIFNREFRAAFRRMLCFRRWPSRQITSVNAAQSTRQGRAISFAVTSR